MISYLLWPKIQAVNELYYTVITQSDQIAHVDSWISNVLPEGQFANTCSAISDPDVVGPNRKSRDFPLTSNSLKLIWSMTTLHSMMANIASHRASVVPWYTTIIIKKKFV